MNREKLIAAGVNYDEGAERFGGQSKLFEKYLAKFFDGPLMENLERQLALDDIGGAFRTAHDLKAAAGNLSLNAYYDKISALTELLRAENGQTACASALAQAKAMYDAAKRASKE